MDPFSARNTRARFQHDVKLCNGLGLGERIPRILATDMQLSLSLSLIMLLLPKKYP